MLGLPSTVAVPGFLRMLELPVASLLAHNSPAVSVQPLQDFLNLHRSESHSAEHAAQR